MAPGRRLPVMATEFGWDEVHHRQSAMRPDPATLPGHRYQEAIVSAFDNAAMGWQAWCFSHLFTPALLANSSFAPSGDFGAFIRNALRIRKTLSRG